MKKEFSFRGAPMRTCLAAAVVLAALAGGCANHPPAPVIERTAPVEIEPARITGGAAAHGDQADQAGFYTVKKGDTLYSISLDHGQSYRDIAAWNNLEDPGRIQTGQKLRVMPPAPEAESTAPVAVAKPVAMSTLPEAAATPARGRESPAVVAGVASAGDAVKHEPKGGKQPYSEEALARLQQPDAVAPSADAKPAAAAVVAEKVAEKPAEKLPPPPPTNDNVEWSWPAAGQTIASFSEGSNKGIDIAARMGEPVLAAASGKVILVSSALRGYGNFVIVKHSPLYLSVYAHNSRILVKEEQMVNRGEKIAEIGSSDADRPRLHFEIRRQGKPVDPVKFLPAR